MKPAIRAALCAAILATATAAHAQSWPSRPVKLIVPTGPGAATDVMARLMAESVTRGLGQLCACAAVAVARIAAQSAARIAGFMFPPTASVQQRCLPPSTARSRRR